MQKFLRAVILMASLLMIAACNLGRGFRGPEDYNIGWARHQLTNQKEVDLALYSCGVMGLSEGFGVDRSENGRAAIQECMFAKGFYLKSGFGGTCSLPSYRARIPACATAPLRSRDSYYGN